MTGHRKRFARRGFTVRDLAVLMSVAVVAGSLLFPLMGANRDLSKTQVCANNLRQLYAGLVAYVNQYNSYPPHAPWPTYAPSWEQINGLRTSGWDPNIGWILTYGLGIVPPATYTDTGHFKWHSVPLSELPGVCVCPSLPPEMTDPANPEIADPAYDASYPLESLLYQYALSYQTSGTCRAAVRISRQRSGIYPSYGGRNALIPDPSSQPAAQLADNSQRGGNPHVWVMQRKPGAAPDDPSDNGQEFACWVQAVHPAEVQNPGRTYYLADSRDYRPAPKGQTYSYYAPAGDNRGWRSGWGNKVFLGTRHFEYANVLYLDGRVTRGNQTHDPRWNMEYDVNGNGQSNRWRMSTFATSLDLALIKTQVHTMPVLSAKGWESFFEGNGLRAK